jgi:hypothetical protein
MATPPPGSPTQQRRTNRHKRQGPAVSVAEAGRAVGPSRPRAGQAGQAPSARTGRPGYGALSMLVSSPAAEHVHGERPLPVAVLAQARPQRHPGVGAPQVDRPDLVLDPLHQPGHRRPVGHVQGHPQRRRAGQAGGHPLGPGPSRSATTTDRAPRP